MAAADNPLLVADFDFPPFDRVEPSHVRPGIHELLTRLVSHAFLHPDFHHWLSVSPSHLSEI
jgi:hypothetical protein